MKKPMTIQPHTTASPKNVASHRKTKVGSPEKPLFEISNIEDELLTKEEIARFLKVSIKMIDKMVSMNDIPHCKIGKLVRFSKQMVMEKMIVRQNAG